MSIESISWNTDRPVEAAVTVFKLEGACSPNLYAKPGCIVMRSLLLFEETRNQYPFRLTGRADAESIARYFTVYTKLASYFPAHK